MKRRRGTISRLRDALVEAINCVEETELLYDFVYEELCGLYPEYERKVSALTEAVACFEHVIHCSCLDDEDKKFIPEKWLTIMDRRKELAREKMRAKIAAIMNKKQGWTLP